MFKIVSSPFRRFQFHVQVKDPKIFGGDFNRLNEKNHLNKRCNGRQIIFWTMNLRRKLLEIQWSESWLCGSFVPLKIPEMLIFSIGFYENYVVYLILVIITAMGSSK